MDAKKIGERIKRMRLERGWTLEDVSNKFDEKNLLASTNAIWKWEKGVSIPDIDNLLFLTELYGITVDYLFEDENIQETFAKKYFISTIDWYKEFEDTADKDRALIEQSSLVHKTFKKLCYKAMSGNLTYTEKEELRFLYDLFFCENNLPYRFFLRKLREISVEPQSKEERWWEISKIKNDHYFYKLGFTDLQELGVSDPFVDQSIDMLEPWELDAMLAEIQVENAFPSGTSFDFWIKKYKEKNGCDFDPEALNKKLIRYLVSKGATLNNNYMGEYITKTTTVRTVDEIERCYLAAKKPLDVFVYSNDDYSHYYVENTAKNRFLVNYAYQFKLLREALYSDDEIFEFLNSGNDLDDETIIRLAETKGINTDRDIYEVIGELGVDLDLLIGQIREYREKENQISNDLDTLDRLMEDLNNGTRENMQLSWELEGASYKDKKRYIDKKNKTLTYKQFVDGRDKNATEQLLSSLDSMTMEEIRNEFFHVGGKRNG